MDKLILKLTEFSLRKWVLISIGVSILAFLILTILDSFPAFCLNAILVQLSSLLLTGSLTVYAINNIAKVKTILILAIVSAAISMFGLYSVFGSNPLFLNFNCLSTVDLVAYYLEQGAFLGLLQYAVMGTAYVIGLSSLNRRYKAVWVIFTCIYVLSFFVELLFTSKSHNYHTICGILAIIILILEIGAIIAMLVMGRKEISNDLVYDMSKPNASTPAISTPSVAPEPESPSMVAKSEVLFKLKELLDANVLSQTEFDVKKAEVLNGEIIPLQAVNELVEMKKLLDANVITQSDFENKKRSIISTQSAQLSTTTSARSSAAVSSSSPNSRKDSKDSNSRTNLSIWFIVAGFIFVLVVVILVISSGYNDSSDSNNYGQEAAAEDWASPEMVEEQAVMTQDENDYDYGNSYREESYDSYDYGSDANAWQ